MDESYLSYQQILAEQYEENNAKNLLTFQKEYEDEDIDEYSRHEYERNELEEPESFNKFHGNRNDHQIVLDAAKFDDKTKTSVRYAKDVRTHVIDIDTRFRAYSKNGYPDLTIVLPNGVSIPNTFTPSNESDFVFQLPQPIKNAITLKITSLSLPNVFYTFTESRENLKFYLYDTSNPRNLLGYVKIREGNYLTPQAIVDEIESQLILIPDGSGGGYNFHICYDTVSNRFKFYNTAASFYIDFTPPTIKEPFNNGIGYNLGFQSLTYTSELITLGGTTIPCGGYATGPTGPTAATGPYYVLTSTWGITAEFAPDILGDPYIYMQINDYDVITHQSFKKAFFPVFAKILLSDESKNKLIQDIDLSTVVCREYNFLQPTNVSRFQIKLLDAYGNIIPLQANYSFTLEVEEVLNMSLYHKMREL